MFCYFLQIDVADEDRTLHDQFQHSVLNCRIAICAKTLVLVVQKGNTQYANFTHTRRVYKPYSIVICPETVASAQKLSGYFETF